MNEVIFVVEEAPPDPPSAAPAPPARTGLDLPAHSNMSRDDHRRRVLRLKDHIAAGDIYQANLSRRWRLRLSNRAEVAHVYAALRRANPAPFAASLQLNGMSLLSSSPERLMRIQDGDISTRPIAGTRARQGTAEQDRHDTAD